MRIVDKLNDQTLRSAKPRQKPHKLFDGGGLYLEVFPHGAKLWRLKYRIAGKERRLALGEYPKPVSLAAAREKAKAARALVKNNRDPVTEQRVAKARAAASAEATFKTVALEWLARKNKRRSESYRAVILSALNANLFPRIGSLPIAEIDGPLLLAALRPIEARGALNLLRKVRTWSSLIFRSAIAQGLRKDDPASALVEEFETRKTKHFPALERKDLGDFLRKLAEYPGRPETRIAVKLLMLTAARTIELRGAQWTEFDMDNAVWTIPAERMKMKREHTVPLSRQAVALLKELKQYSEYSPYLFPNHGKHPYMSENTINKVIATLGYKGRTVGHGFRSTFSTTANESWICKDRAIDKSEAIERQLAHEEKDETVAAYNRAKYLQAREWLMQWWGDLLDDAHRGADVVPLKRKKN